jgi:mono/diheme cytochrome c family protein
MTNAAEGKAGIGVLGKTLGFSIGLTLLFTLVTYLLPQVEGEAPVEKEVDLGALTMDSFVALGEELFLNKGTCTLCHKPPPLGRAPDIQGDNMVAVAEQRLADERYKGKAANTEEYIRESLLDPSIYVVTGWGKKGSNDTVSPMPTINKPPIELSAVEMDAIIAYLQSKDGNEVTIVLPTEAPAVAETPATAAGGTPAPAKTPEEAIGKYGCQACHTLLGTEASLGPTLTDAGARLSKQQIVESILEPDAVITEGFTAGIMPKDFADKMTVTELDMIVEFLAAQK